jgi:hypothetical protein
MNAIQNALNQDAREFGWNDIKDHANNAKEQASNAQNWVNERRGHNQLESVNMYTWSAPTVAEGEDTACCSAANPYVPVDVAPIVMVMNIFAPGVGTMIAAYYSDSGCNCKTVTCGIFQMMLAALLVGWIWSICQGVAIYKKSLDWADQQQNPTAASTDADASTDAASTDASDDTTTD